MVIKTGDTEAIFLLQAFLSEELSHKLEEVRYRKINNATIVLQKHVSIIRILNKKIRSHILKIKHLILMYVPFRFVVCLIVEGLSR